MTKKELIAALANVNDDAVVLFGRKKFSFSVHLLHRYILTGIVMRFL